MSYEVLIQNEIKNDIDEEEIENCINIENKIILLGNTNQNDIISNCSGGSRGSICSSVDCEVESNLINNDNDNDIKYTYQMKCYQCGNHLNKRRKYKSDYPINSPFSKIGNGSQIDSNISISNPCHLLTNNSKPFVLKGHEDDFINCIILFIAGFILFLPWLFTFHYLGSPFRKCRVIAIISICLLGLFFILFTLLLSVVVVLVSNPELLTMLQKYWLEYNYNNHSL